MKTLEEMNHVEYAEYIGKYLLNCSDEEFFRVNNEVREWSDRMIANGDHFSEKQRTLISTIRHFHPTRVKRLQNKQSQAAVNNSPRFSLKVNYHKGNSRIFHSSDLRELDNQAESMKRDWTVSSMEIIDNSSNKTAKIPWEEMILYQCYLKS